jgi:flagellar hook protein FlgE
MASEVSTIQSLKAVDAWIDVINANINGGVRTAFKSSRLKFSGSNVDVSRAGSATSLPLQFPEPGLQTANTIIDFSQGAITASTENTHLAIQGDAWFVLATPDLIDTNPASATFGGTLAGQTNAKFYVTRDGEFRTDQNGFLRHSTGLYVVTAGFVSFAAPEDRWSFYYSGTVFGAGSSVRAVYNNLDQTAPAGGIFCRLDTFVQNLQTWGNWMKDNQGNNIIQASSITKITNKQSLAYSQYGSTVFDMQAQVDAGAITANQVNSNIRIRYGYATENTILTKSLEASNASMTQSVPELSLAQKLFSALTKVLQTKQTNVDGVLNLVR